MAGEKKVGKVMGEFMRGKLKSSSGKKVTHPAQAKAIALSDARRAGAHIPKKKRSPMSKAVDKMR